MQVFQGQSTSELRLCRGNNIVETIRLRVIALTCLCLLIAPFVSFAQVAADLAATSGDNTNIASSSDASVPSHEDPGLPSAPNQNDAPAQATPATPSQGNDQGQKKQQEQTKPGNTPSLGDLGFTPQQTQANAQLQAMLDKRTQMLKIHQRLGLITAIPMVAAVITGPEAKAKGKNGQTIKEPTSANLDFHVALGGVTTGLYFATAYYAMFAPKVPGTRKQGAIRVHEALGFIHGPGMILTPILGIMAYKQENAGEKVHGIAAAHGAVAYTTAAAYGASIVAVSWPIHWKFWEGR